MTDVRLTPWHGLFRRVHRVILRRRRACPMCANADNRGPTFISIRKKNRVRSGTPRYEAWSGEPKKINKAFESEGFARRMLRNPRFQTFTITLVVDRFREHLENTRLILPGARVLVGYSGGADSTCLLHLLREAEIDVVAAHLHHGQREEAEKELLLCQAFAKEL